MLDLNSTARSVRGACELNQETVTRSLDDTAAMLGDFRLKKFAAMRIEPQQAGLTRPVPFSFWIDRTSSGAFVWHRSLLEACQPT